MMNPSGNLLNTWGATYERIRRVNEFLVGLEKYSTVSQEENKIFEGQARFFRAFLYFQLAKRHGGVILYTNMDLKKDKNRSSAEETWNLIAEDLDYAASVLPVKWKNEDNGRVTKGAALAFKSRAMLYAQRWDAAKAAADEVIALGVYQLMPQYNDAWKGGNSESILEYNYLVTGPNHTFDKDYATFGEIENQGGSGCPTQEMVEAYESKDGKKVDWSAWYAAGERQCVRPMKTWIPALRLPSPTTGQPGRGGRWRTASTAPPEDIWVTATTPMPRGVPPRVITSGSS